MLDGILTPAFMQAACAHKEEPAEPTTITLKALQEDPTITSVTCPGEITVVSSKGGTEQTKTEASMTESQLTISADNDTHFTISGVDLVINTLGDQCELETESVQEEPEEEIEEQPEEQVVEETLEETEEPEEE